MKNNNTETAAFWEGVFAAESHTPCKYPSDQTKERADWSRGVTWRWEAVQESIRVGKVWWRSRTLRSAVIFGIVGVVLIYLGNHSSNGLMMGAGGGITAGGCFQAALRVITGEPLTRRDYTGQPF